MNVAKIGVADVERLFLNATTPIGRLPCSASLLPCSINSTRKGNGASAPVRKLLVAARKQRIPGALIDEFTRLGCEVLAICVTSSEACRHLTSSEVDLALLDIGLDHKSALEIEIHLTVRQIPTLYLVEGVEGSLPLRLKSGFVAALPTPVAVADILNFVEIG